MRYVAMFDTNILVSGVGWRGSPYRCLELARAGVVEGVTCQELLDEFVEKLETKLHFSSTQVTDTVADLLTFLRLVTMIWSCNSVRGEVSGSFLITSISSAVTMKLLFSSTSCKRSVKSRAIRFFRLMWNSSARTIVGTRIKHSPRSERSKT